MMRPSHLAYPISLLSEPAERQGHTLKRNIGLQLGTEFAKRGPIKVPRPRQSQSWHLPLSKAKASQY